MSRISSAAEHHIAYRACHIDNGEFPVQTADSVNAVDHDTRAITPRGVDGEQYDSDAYSYLPCSISLISNRQVMCVSYQLPSHHNPPGYK